ncbi:MAG: hypothetical protein ABEK50_16695, partial [bacterium]
MDNNELMATGLSAVVAGVLIYALGQQFHILRDAQLHLESNPRIRWFDWRLLKHTTVVVIFAVLYQWLPWDGLLVSLGLAVGLWWLAIWTSPAPVIGWG